MTEGSGGTVHDISGTGAHATSTGGGARWVNGRRGAASGFNAAGYLQTPDFGTPSKFTVAASLKVNIFGSYNTVFVGVNGWGSFNFHLVTGNTGYCGTNIATRWDFADFGGKLTTGEWFWAAFSYDGTYGRFYKDGNLILGPKAMTATTAWGGVRFSSSDTLQGYLDSAWIWGRALSEEEVRLLAVDDTPLIRPSRLAHLSLAVSAAGGLTYPQLERSTRGLGRGIY